MALDDLLLRLEGQATDTPDTPCSHPEVSVKPLPDKACTLDTPDTSQNPSAKDWALAEGCGIAIVKTDDDRRTCSQCLNLRGRACAIAKPGGLVSANLGYQPTTAVLQRCAGYLPNPNDPDKRLGRERWTGLIQKVGK